MQSQLKSFLSNGNRQHNYPPRSSQSNDPTTNGLQTYDELNKTFKQITYILESAIRYDKQLIYTAATINVKENPKEKMDSKIIKADSNQKESSQIIVSSRNSKMQSILSYSDSHSILKRSKSVKSKKMLS
ncbi:hypothetical protein ABPG74_012498 [Tetrahymena malaccensis]